MMNLWTDCCEVIRFACEAQAVISARVALFASGDPSAAAEAELMVSEKFMAFADAQVAAERALAEGRGLFEAFASAYEPVRSRVRSNSERLRPTFP